MTIKKYTKEEIDGMKDKTDYDRVKNMPEEEVRNNAKSDPDAPLQSESDLKKFKRVKRPRNKINEDDKN